jgi:hypothetical protein
VVRDGRPMTGLVGTPYYGFTRPPLRSSERAGLPATPPAARRMELEGESCAAGPFVSLPTFLGRPSSPPGTDPGAWAPGPTTWAALLLSMAVELRPAHDKQRPRGPPGNSACCKEGVGGGRPAPPTPSSPTDTAWPIELPLQRTLESSSLLGAPPPFDPSTPPALSLSLLPPRWLPCVGAGTRE